MCYNEDNTVAIETVDDHLVWLTEIFDGIRAENFNYMSAMSVFLERESNFLGRTISIDDTMPEKEAVKKFRDWAVLIHPTMSPMPKKLVSFL